MTAKHTPGPWEVDHDAIYCAESGDIIAEIDFARDEYSANARLIAASPDLLEALEEARKRLNGAGMLGGPDDPVNAAIAKAKGERA